MIQTADLWNRKRPLYQLSHHHHHKWSFLKQQTVKASCELFFDETCKKVLINQGRIWLVKSETGKRLHVPQPVWPDWAIFRIIWGLFGPFWKYHVLSKSCCGYFLGQLLEKLGILLFKHLVTLLYISTMTLGISITRLGYFYYIQETNSFYKSSPDIWQLFWAILKWSLFS